MMAEETGTSNIVHYGYGKCKRVIRSIIAEEIHSLVLAYDNAYMIRHTHTLTEILGRDVEMEGYIDCRSAFKVIAKDGNPTEKSVQVYIHALRQSYANE